MSALYRVLGISKQAFHQGLDRELKRREEQFQLMQIIRDIRDNHPRLSCRSMYSMLKPQYMGRDQFEAFCHRRGFKVPINKRYHRTTDSYGVQRFPNLLLQTDEITAINQVWVSDITYYQLKDQVCYITFILDLYSRRIVGWKLSTSLHTEETTLKAMGMALRERRITPRSNLIIHSDGGGQYYSKAFQTLTARYGIRNSMCDSVYENAHAERINGTIKNDYLIPFNPQTYIDLEKDLEKAVNLYNTQRPHHALDKCTPEEFERLTSAGLMDKTWTINKNKTNIKKEKVNIRITSN
jgi:putative transposase